MTPLMISGPSLPVVMFAPLISVVLSSRNGKLIEFKKDLICSIRITCGTFTSTTTMYSWDIMLAEKDMIKG